MKARHCLYNLGHDRHRHIRRARMSRAWFALGVAIAVEVAATLALKAALSNPAWYVLVVVGYTSALVLLAVCLRLGLHVGVAYGIWGASGVALTAVLSAVIFGDPLTPVMGIGIILIIGGVLLVEVGSQRAIAAREREQEQVAA
jgi:small multidrug resistance pump